MTFRPRYSLLALLLFTALVAGGVKLWRGPYHVVDRPSPLEEDEYTYYRNWDGTRIVNGVRVTRSLNAEGKLTNVYAEVYRNGTRLAAWVNIQCGPYSCYDRVDIESPDLSESEQRNLAAITEQHLRLIAAQDSEPLLLKSPNVRDVSTR